MQAKGFSDIFISYGILQKGKQYFPPLRILLGICSKQHSTLQEERLTEKCLFQNSTSCRGENALELRVALRGGKMDRPRE